MSNRSAGTAGGAEGLAGEAGPPFSVVVLAAGKGTRMHSELPKVLHDAAGASLLEHVLRAVEPLGPSKTVVVVGHGAERIEARFAAAKRRGRVQFVEQRELLGTGHALLQAQGALAGLEGCVVVLNGDGPLVTSETIASLVSAQAGRSGMTLITCEVSQPEGLGRILRDATGAVVGVVEQKDATPEQLRTHEINPGIYAFDAAVFELCAQLSDDNAAGEYYITELLELYLRAGKQVTAVEVSDEQEVLAVNNREELARADKALRDRTRRRWLLSGVTMIAPDQVFLDEDVKLGRDVVIHPGVHLLGGTTVGEGAVIGPGVVLSGCEVRAGASVPANRVATGETF